MRIDTSNIMDVEELIEHLGMTQSEFGRALGRSRAYVFALTSGHNRPGAAFAAAVMARFPVWGVVDPERGGIGFCRPEDDGDGESAAA